MNPPVNLTREAPEEWSALAACARGGALFVAVAHEAPTVALAVYRATEPDARALFAREFPERPDVCLYRATPLVLLAPVVAL